MRQIRTRVAFAALAAAAHAAFAQPTWNDVPIATVPTATGFKTLRVDVFAPVGPFVGPRPLALYVHGGGWSGGDHNNGGSFFNPLRSQGYVVATCTYRLSQEAIFPAQIHDVKGAVRYFRANASLYNIDPRRIAVGGASAGGHLVALLGTAGDVPGLEGTTGGNTEWSSRVQAVVDFFGPTDLLQMNPDVTVPPGSTIDHDAAGSPESRLIGFSGVGQGIGVLRANVNNPAPPFPEKAALVASTNPITHATPDDPPTFIAHGDSDTVVPLRQSRRLRDALAPLGVPVSLLEVAGGTHGPLGGAAETAARAFVVTELARCPGDLTRDGNSDLADFFAFFGWFDAEDPRADRTLDGQIDLEDSFDFFLAYDQGC